MNFELLIGGAAAIGALIWAFIKGQSLGQAKQKEINDKANLEHQKESGKFVKLLYERIEKQRRKDQEDIDAYARSIQEKVARKLRNPPILNGKDAKERLERALKALDNE